LKLTDSQEQAAAILIFVLRRRQRDENYNMRL